MIQIDELQESLSMTNGGSEPVAIGVADQELRVHS